MVEIALIIDPDHDGTTAFSGSITSALRRDASCAWKIKKHRYRGAFIFK
ncbi:hypothetical protein [Microvirga vignae]|nr:hypothetical protein [Microvirga vignae]